MGAAEAFAAPLKLTATARSRDEPKVHPLRLPEPLPLSESPSLSRIQQPGVLQQSLG